MPEAETKLLIVGGGRMGEALVGGLVASGRIAPRALAVVETREERRDELLARHDEVRIVAEALAAPSAVLAVKPADAERACEALSSTGCKRVLSIVAGLSTGRLEGLLAPGAAVVRAMPNTPALLGAGASAFCLGRHADEEDAQWAEEVLGALGMVVRLPEYLLDTVTGLSGSGPAYVFAVAEALIDAGVLLGLDRSTSAKLVVQTILGSARMLAESGESPEALRQAVTSPGGTTAAGLFALERAGVRAGLIEAVVAATQRSKGVASSD